jgi:hypothetical protein
MNPYTTTTGFAKITFAAIFFFIYLAPGPMIGQNKIVLKKNWKRKCIRQGALIGVTRKGEEYQFSKWTDICDCLPAVQKNFWIVDTIKKNTLSLSRYRFSISDHIDTLTGKHAPKEKRYMYLKSLPAPDGKAKHEKRIYKVSVFRVEVDQHLVIPYDSIESFTMARAHIKNCVNNFERSYLMLPVTNNRKQDIALALVYITWIVVETGVNTTKAVAEKVSDNHRQIYRYNIGEWSIKIK